MSEGRFNNPVVASLAGVRDFFASQKLSSRFSGEVQADGKTILVTGANSGLGFALAVEFARRGGRVIMAGRSDIPGAGNRVKRLSGSEKVEMRYVDLSRIETIHELVDSLVSDSIKLDICILNAATALPSSRKASSGQDTMFMVNYLSNVVLTRLLIAHSVLPRADPFPQQPPLWETDPIATGPNGKIEVSPGERKNRTRQPARLIFISSDSHQGASAIDYDEFGHYFDYGVSKAISNYSYFKLVLNTYATELSRRVNSEGVRLSVNAICPGPVHSNILKEAPWLLRMILKGIFRIVFKSPAKAASPVVYMALSEDYHGTTNEYLHMFNPKRMDPKVYDGEEGKKLWDRSMELLSRIDPGFQSYA